MSRDELKRQCAGAALLLKDARRKLEQANRHLVAVKRKPVGIESAARGSAIQAVEQEAKRSA
jgi:hypothetical protein